MSFRETRECMVSIVASTIDIPSLACYYLLLKLQTAQPHTCRDEEPFVPWLGQDVRYWGGTPHALNSVLAASTCLRVFFFSPGHFLLVTWQLCTVGCLATSPGGANIVYTDVLNFHLLIHTTIFYYIFIIS